MRKTETFIEQDAPFRAYDDAMTGLIMELGTKYPTRSNLALTALKQAQREVAAMRTENALGILNK